VSDGTLVGIEVDGDRVTVVESLGGMAVASRTLQHGSLAESLEAALEAVPHKRGGPPVRVVVVTTGTALRRLDATESLLASRETFEEAVYSVMPMARDVTSVAGLVFDRAALVGDAVTGAVAAVAPLAAIDEVYTALGEANVEVVASPLVLSGHDGVWVGLHMSAAEATLVSGGFPVAFRQLRAGGLAGVASVLGDGVDVEQGRGRLEAAVTRTGVQDPIADAEVSRYLRMVAAELVQTLNYWRSQGEQIPDGDTVAVYGAGAASVAVRTAFEEESLTAQVPEALLNQMVYVSPAEREASMLAFLASLSVGEQAPQSVFANPSAEALAARRKARRRRSIKWASAAGTALAVVALLGFPFATGFLEARSADAQLAQAKAAAAPLAGVYHQTVDLAARRDIVETATAAEPSWSQAVRTVYATAPEGAQVTRMTASDENGSVMVAVEALLPGGTYEDLSAWLDRLVTERGVLNAFSSGFSVSGGTAAYQLSFVLPTSLIPSLRSPAGPGQAASPAPGDTAVAASPSPESPSAPPSPVAVAPTPSASPSVPASPASPTAPAPKPSAPASAPAPTASSAAASAKPSAPASPTGGTS
jgi:hypothetical protein